jgi:hypothetical protein
MQAVEVEQDFTCSSVCSGDRIVIPFVSLNLRMDYPEHSDKDDDDNTDNNHHEHTTTNSSHNDEDKDGDACSTRPAKGSRALF